MQTAAPPAPMRCLVNRKTLLLGLKRIAPAIAREGCFPSVTSVKLTATDSALILWATNLELGAEIRMPADIDQFGEVALPFRRFSRLVQAAPDAPLELTATPDGYGARLQWAEAEYLVYGIPPDQAIPVPQQADDAPVMQVDPAALRHLLAHTTFATAMDDTRPYLTGVCLTLSGNRLRAIATDSVRIGVAWADAEQVTGEFPGVIVPRPTCVYLAQLLARTSEPVEIRVSRDTSARSLPALLVFVQIGDTQVVSRLMEGTYPDILRLVPTEYSMTAALDRQSWLAILRRQAVLPKDGAVKMEFDAQGVYLFTSVPEVGTAQERIQGTYTGEPLQVGFNARFLIECLSRLTTEKVTMELSGARNPVRIRPVGNDDAMHVVLPLITY